MFALILLGQRQSLNGKIIALSAAAGEDYFLSISTDEMSHLVSGGLRGVTDRVTPIMK